MTVGEALKQMRLQAGLTQTEMTAGVVSESFYSKIERGVHAVDVQVLINILSDVAGSITSNAIFTSL